MRSRHIVSKRPQCADHGVAGWAMAGFGKPPGSRIVRISPVSVNTPESRHCLRQLVEDSVAILWNPHKRERERETALGRASFQVPHWSVPAEIVFRGCNLVLVIKACQGKGQINLTSLGKVYCSAHDNTELMLMFTVFLSCSELWLSILINTEYRVVWELTFLEPNLSYIYTEDCVFYRSKIKWNNFLSSFIFLTSVGSIGATHSRVGIHEVKIQI